ncbi:MAG TPA: MFS transporter [Rhodocyclaceae bacterium]|nr:MFS transporter [Rhodocyclaceae bacterium]
MHALINDPLARRDIHTISIVGLAHGVSHFFHLMLPPLFPWLMRDFSLNYTQAGVLMTVFFVVSGIGQALAGFVVDRFGARRALFSGVGLLAVSGFLLGFASSYAGLATAAALAGLGNSVFHPADFTILNRCIAQPRLGHAFSVHGLSGNLGWAAGPVFMAGIATVAGWQAAAFAAGGIGLAMLAILGWQRSALEPGQENDTPSGGSHSAGKAASADGSALAFLRLLPVWLCFGYFVFTTAAFGFLQNYAPPALAGLYALSLGVATLGLTAYLIGGVAGMAAGGFLAARVDAGERIIVRALGVGASIALLLAAGWLPSWFVTPLMFAMGAAVGVAGPSRDLLVRRAAMSTTGAGAYGRIYGFVYSGLDIGLASAPLIFGPLMDAGRFALSFALIGALQAVAIFTAATVGSRVVPEHAKPARAA